MKLKIMKLKNLLILVVVFLIIFSFPTGKIGYGKEVRAITYDGGIEWDSAKEVTWLGNSTNATIYRNNESYDIVWQDARNGNWEIYYTKVTYFGFKLVNDSRITNFAGDDIKPSIVSRGEHIFVVWQRNVGAHWDIYFAKLLYSNKNISIEVPPKLLRHGGNATAPKIAIDSQGFLHVVWQEYINGQWDVMYYKIDEEGNPVFSPIDISNDHTNSTEPVIVTAPNNQVNVLWLDDNITPGYSIMYRGLDCCGYFRTPVRRISVVSPNTEISASYENGVNVAFSCERENKSSEIVFTKLNDTGVTTIDDKNLTSLDSINSDEPAISSFRERNFVVWRDNNKQIKFAIYDFRGSRIIKNVNISNENSSEPHIALGNERVTILWEEKIGDEKHIFMRSGRFPNVKVENMEIKQVGNEGKLQINTTVYSDTEEKINVEYEMYEDNSSVKWGNISLAGRTTLSFILPISGGWHTILFSLDPQNKIFESNESDNTWSEKIFVKSYSYQISVKGDYYITPGNQTNISVSIINTGNWEDNYTLSFENISSEISLYPLFSRISLNSSEEKTVNFTLLIKRNAKIGNYTITLNVRSNSNISVARNITVHVIPKIYFSIQYNNLYYVLPGREYDITIKILNLGNCNDSYSLLMFSNSTWPITLENITENISAGDIGYAIIHVYIPNGTDAFSKEFLFLAVQSSKSGMSENATLMIVVSPEHSAKAFVIDSNFTGGDYYFEIMILNEGNIVDFFNFNVSGELENHSILDSYSALIQKGGKYIVNMSVYIPTDYPAGSYELYFNVFSGNISLLSLPLSLTIPSIYSFSAHATSKGATITLTVKNEGNTADSITIVPYMKENTTWILKYLGRNYTNVTYVVLQPNQTAKVYITPKEKLQTGEYSVNIILKSSSGIEKNITVKMSIGEENRGIWGIIMDNLLYIVIGVVAVAAIVIYLSTRE